MRVVKPPVALTWTQRVRCDCSAELEVMASDVVRQRPLACGWEYRCVCPCCFRFVYLREADIPQAVRLTLNEVGPFDLE